MGTVAGEAPDAPVMCPFRLATGLPCPFCGMTRSLFAVGDGRLGDAFALAPLGPLLPLLALLAGVVAIRAIVRRRPVSWPRPLLMVGVAVLAVSWSFQLAGGVT